MTAMTCRAAGNRWLESPLAGRSGLAFPRYHRGMMPASAPLAPATNSDVFKRSVQAILTAGGSRRLDPLGEAQV